ncbi:MAG: hypothetical protein PHF67_01555 [Candidatus Nanoarchaeia archaeon]|nr:hypothetical protein [Candidatus Nanoarchaeia archaeon]
MAIKISDGRVTYQPQPAPNEYALATRTGYKPCFENSFLFCRIGRKPGSKPTNPVLEFKLFGDYDLTFFNERNPIRTQLEGIQHTLADLGQEWLILTHIYMDDRLIALINSKNESETPGVLYLSEGDNHSKVALSSQSGFNYLRLQALCEPFLYSPDLRRTYERRVQEIKDEIIEASGSNVPDPQAFLDHFAELNSLRVQEIDKIKDYFRRKKLERMK